MKKIGLFFVMGLVLAGLPSQADAYHVKIHNHTDTEAIVQLWLADWTVYSVETVIPPRASHTFKTGTECPHALTGTVLTLVNSGTARENIKLTCLGPIREKTDFVVNCWPNCFNSEWTILQVQDGSFHFRNGDHTDNRISIYNPNDITATVQFWIGYDVYAEAVIPPSGSFIYEPPIDAANVCPAAITGSIPSNESPNSDLAVQIKPICMMEGERDKDKIKFCAPLCGKYDFTITQHEDNSWHFRRGKDNYGTPPQSASEEVNITVADDNVSNRPPVLLPIGNKSVRHGHLLKFKITATDPDGNALTFSAKKLPDGGSFNPNTQEFRWTPVFSQAGTIHKVTFVVTDDGTPPQSASETITIVVDELQALSK